MGKAGDFGRHRSSVRARPVAKLLGFFKSVLVGGAVLGLIQPAVAVGVDVAPAQSIFPTSGQGLFAALRDLDGSTSGPAEVRHTRDGEQFGALSSFAKSLGAEPQSLSKQPQVEQAIYQELAEFARSVGAARPASNPPTVKLAEADNAVDALKDFLSKNSSPPAAGAPPAPAPVPVTPSRPVVDAHFMGDKVCMTCHASYAESFSKTLMGRIWRTQPGKFACENCHGPGSEHVKLGGGRGVGGIISFRSNDLTRSVQENNAICLNCHERGQRTYWSGSTHEVRNVACTNCHTVMRSVSAKFGLKTVYEPETCFQCHKEKRAQVMGRPSHMPLREGKMVCSDCHNPHGTANEALLWTATVNDTCYKCHAEKRGPFLFEHSPVRENCLNCHDAHGSINEYMLKISRPRLCTECHGFGHGPSSAVPSYQIMGRSCNNCHTQVHGTNDPSGALLHR
jgi:DmsE family decaheme c-type cytochrome